MGVKTPPIAWIGVAITAAITFIRLARLFCQLSEMTVT